MSVRADEQSPLLAEYEGFGRHEHNSESDAPLPPRRDAKFQRYILILTITLVVIVDFGAFITNAPQNDILEGIICDNYYRNSDIQIPADTRNGTSVQVRECNVDAVQAELAIVNQLYTTFEQIPSILLAVPYGILADKVGRKPVLLLALLGIILDDISLKIICWFPAVFPLRSVWLVSQFRLIGGGDMIATSMILTTVADVFDDDQRAGVLYKLFAAVLVAGIAANPLAAALMTKSSWIPFFFSPILMIIGWLIVAFLLPETLPKKKPSPTPSMPEEDVSPKPRTFVQKVRHLFVAFKESTIFLLSNFNIVLLLVCFFIAVIDRHTNGFQLQYVRKRFGWSYGQASILLSLRGIITMALLLGILPLFARYLVNKRHLTVPQKDLLIARISAVVLTVGFILLTLSFNVPMLIFAIIILALGAGFPISARTLITGFVEPTQVGRLYSAVAVMSSIGALVSGPLIAGTFKWGLHLGGGWVGMPWLVTGAISMVAVIATWLVRLDRSISLG